MRFVSVLAASLCFITFAHAQDTPSAPNISQPPDAALPAAPTYELRWRPQLGELRVMRLSVEQKISGAPGQQLTQRVEMDYAFKVLGLADDGSFTVSNTFRAVRVTRTAPGMQVNFDSDKPSKNLTEELKTYKAMAGARLNLRFSNRGTLLEVKDDADFYNRIFAALGVKPEDRNAMRALAKTGAGNQSFRNIGNTIASFPIAPVSIGQTWPKIDAVSSSDALIYDGICTLQSVEKSKATIAVESQIKPDPNQTKNALQTLNGLRGTQSGTYQVELDSGWTTDALLTQTLQAKLLDVGGLVAPDAKGKGKGTPFELTSTFKLRTLGVRRGK